MKRRQRIKAWVNGDHRVTGILAALALLAPALGWGACGQEAQRHYERAYQIRESAIAQHNVCQQVCLEKMLYFFKRSVDLCPAYPEAHNDLGDVHEQLGHYPEARTHYGRAIELNPELGVAYFNLGHAYIHSGDYSEAVRTFQEWQQRHPNDQWAQEGEAHARRLMAQQMPDAEAIRMRLGGGEIRLMGPGGIKPDRRLPMHIPFAYDSDELLPEAQPSLRELATALQDVLSSSNSAAFVIEGHTDLQGTEEYNLDLSRRRARRVVEALMKGFNLPKNRLAVQGYGKTRPLVPGTTEPDHARNRRVEVVRVETSEFASLIEDASVAPVEPLSGQTPASLVVEAAVFYEDAESRPRKLESGAALRSGDGYRVYFEPQQPCHVYIVQTDASGKLFYLYPNPEYGTRDNYAQARAAHWIPARDKWFELDKTRGEEKLYLIAARERREDIEDLLARYIRASAPAAQPQDQQELTAVLKLMGVAGTRPGKKTIEVTASAGQPAKVAVDQLVRDGASLAYTFSFQHE